ncbi:MAG TPA: dihydrofolate reductase family protein, partial [Nakamurella sp.]
SEVDLRAAVQGLADRGLHRIHCEGGPALLGALIANDLLDECCLTIAPLFLGSASTRLLPTDLTDPVAWTPSSLRIAGAHLFARYLRAVG